MCEELEKGEECTYIADPGEEAQDRRDARSTDTRSVFSISVGSRYNEQAERAFNRRLSVCRLNKHFIPRGHHHVCTCINMYKIPFVYGTDVSYLHVGIHGAN